MSKLYEKQLKPTYKNDEITNKIWQIRTRYIATETHSACFYDIEKIIPQKTSHGHSPRS